MSWDRRYWDIAENNYWTPDRLGLQSLQFELQNGLACVRDEHVVGGRSLYSRKESFEALRERLCASEEILNHFFSLTFSITGDDVIRELFLTPFSFADSGPFEMIGREARTRYGWKASENVTQQDGFFVSQRSAVGVEVKLSALSSPDQIKKYAALLAWEELHSGKKEQIGLMFIVPEYRVTDHWRTVGLSGPTIDRSFVRTPWKRKPSNRIAQFFEEQESAVFSVFDRMEMKVVSWSEFRDHVVEIQQSLSATDRRDQTLLRLLTGFLSQLESHKGTGISH